MEFTNEFNVVLMLYMIGVKFFQFWDKFIHASNKGRPYDINI